MHGVKTSTIILPRAYTYEMRSTLESEAIEELSIRERYANDFNFRFAVNELHQKRLGAPGECLDCMMMAARIATPKPNTPAGFAQACMEQIVYTHPTQDEVDRLFASGEQQP